MDVDVPAPLVDRTLAIERQVRIVATLILGVILVPLIGMLVAFGWLAATRTDPVPFLIAMPFLVVIGTVAFLLRRHFMGRRLTLTRKGIVLSWRGVVPWEAVVSFHRSFLRSGPLALVLTYARPNGRNTSTMIPQGLEEFPALVEFLRAWAGSRGILFPKKVTIFGYGY